MTDGIVYGYGENLYKIGNDFYSETLEEHDLVLNVVAIPKVTPDDWAGVTMNNLGHFEGEISRIEEFQSEKLRNNIEVGINLSSYVQKVRKSIKLKKVENTNFIRNNKRDLLVIDSKFLIEHVGINPKSDLFVFPMYDNGAYVGIEVIDIWPTMLTLQATYRTITNYLRQESLYEDRWPYTHTWQNGLEFAHLAPIIRTDTFSIWSTGYFHSFNSLYLRDEFFPKLGPTDYVLINDWGAVYPSSTLIISKARYKNNIFWCANGEVEVEYLKKGKIDQVHLISHNTFIDHTTFTVKNISKKYDAIFCQTVIPFKRPILTSKLSNIVYSTGSTPSIEYQRMISSCNGELMVASSPSQVSTLMNQSYCGLSLSIAEGGNYATTEYLLSGIPVVNTKNLGGRDTYLDNTNSITAQEDTPKEIKRCVEYIKNNIHKFNPSTIRSSALRKNEEMLQTLKNKILYPICSAYGVSNQMVDKLVQDALSNQRSGSKGRTVFQPESSMAKIT